MNRWLWAIVGVAACGWNLPLGAEEPAERFLEKLREAGLYDIASDYLDLMQDSPLVSTRFKEVLPYERAVTLLRQARSNRDLVIREKQLDAAQQALKQFQAERSDHPLLFDAQRESANVVVERAHLKLERAKKPSEAANKALLISDARSLFDEAHKLFTNQHTELKTRLEGIPKVLDPKKDEKRIEARDQMRGHYLQALVLAAVVLEEAADTVEKGSDAYKDYLTTAIKQNDTIYKNYRKFIAGLYARLYQGRCYQKLGNLKEALSYYGELMANEDDDSDVMKLRIEATLYACECWLDPSLGKSVEAIQKGRELVAKIPPHQQRDESVLKLRLVVARASKQYAEELRQKDPKDRQIGPILLEARKFAQAVANVNSDFQKEAQKLLGELGGAVVAPTTKKSYKKFAEAKTAALESYEEIKAPKTNIDYLTEQLPQTTDAEERKAMEAQIAESRILFEQGSRDTIRICRDALGMADTDTDIEDVNSIRNLLCYLHYSMANYYDAAAIGEFVARRFPETAAARTCARIAMASYLKLFQEAKENAKPQIDRWLDELDKDSDGRISLEELNAADDAIKAALASADVNQDNRIDNSELIRLATRFESDRIVDVCNYITQKWADQTEAQEALGTLISFMISEAQLAKAELFLKQIPEDSPQRGAAELRIGQALWGSYVRGMQQLREQQDSAVKAGADKTAVEQQSAASRAELLEVKNRAEKTLDDGVQRMEKSGKIDATLVSAVLSLAQISVDTNQAPKAVALLENDIFGPLKLVAEKHESTQRRGFAEDTYKISLRAYISALSQKDADSKRLIEKANEMMSLLKEAMGSSADGQKALISVYITLARELEQQIKLAPEDTRTNLLHGFRTFLEQVGAGSKELNVLYWVGSTYSSMAESNPQSKDAADYYKRAVDTYQSIIDKGSRKELVLDSGIKNQVYIQLARTKRQQGDFDGAVGLLKDILTENAVLLPVQIEAATTLQEWGAKDPQKYVAAGSGAFPNGKKGMTVWGWGLIANRVANKSQFHNQFYDARYNLATCQYRFALAQKEPDKRDKYLKMARNAISTTVDLYPNLAGDATASQRDFTMAYDQLLKLIQREMKEQETGLAGLKKQKPALPKAG